MLVKLTESDWFEKIFIHSPVATFKDIRREFRLPQINY